ncbi:MAG TPA: choice-of-anchor P family protein [Streptosporangiaceae bacterium]|nr:choice-of-anchor P family protein [Streptosporangiaceae bacterium]
MFRKMYLLALVATTGLVASVLTAAAPAMAQVAAAEMGFQGSAYGTQITVGSTVTSGRSALSTLGCTSQTGVTHTNNIASVSVPPLLSTGTVTTSTASQATPGGPASASKATTQSVNVLGGLVTATAVQAVSTTTETAPGSFSTSAAGTQFADLVVAGTPISATPGPNTKINLAGIGFVVLNQQASTVTSTGASLTVIAIHMVVTQPNPTAKVGTQIVVSFAHSALGGPVSGLLDGLSYGASANVGTTVIAGREFPEPLSCLGTGGKTLTNQGAGLSIPGILTSGTVTDTVQGTATPTAASATATSTVQGLNLLGGLVQAAAIKAAVSATGNPPAFNDPSVFLKLTVAGHPGVGSNVAPNTKLTIAGLGTLWLHRRMETSHQITVIMVQLVVTVPGNPQGLKPGTTVNVASAQASVN